MLNVPNPPAAATVLVVKPWVAVPVAESAAAVVEFIVIKLAKALIPFPIPPTRLPIPLVKVPTTFKVTPIPAVNAANFTMLAATLGSSLLKASAALLIPSLTASIIGVNASPISRNEFFNLFIETWSLSFDVLLTFAKACSVAPADFSICLLLSIKVSYCAPHNAVTNVKASVLLNNCAMASALPPVSFFIIFNTPASPSDSIIDWAFA